MDGIGAGLARRYGPSFEFCFVPGFRNFVVHLIRGGLSEEQARAAAEQSHGK
jgi:hypothetical protein